MKSVLSGVFCCLLLGACTAVGGGRASSAETSWETNWTRSPLNELCDRYMRAVLNNEEPTERLIQNAKNEILKSGIEKELIHRGMPKDHCYDKARHDLAIEKRLSKEQQLLEQELLANMPKTPQFIKPKATKPVSKPIQKMI